MKTVEETKAESQSEVLSFTSDEKFHVQGRGDSYIVKCPITCYSFDWILNRDAIINGTTFKILAVERFAKGGPTRKGEAISLLVNSMSY